MRIVQYNKITEIKNPRVVKTKNGRMIISSNFPAHGSKK